MESEKEIVGRLEEWIATRRTPPTVFDVIATGNADLVAAYVLKAFQAPTRETVLARLFDERGQYVGLGSVTAAPLLCIIDRLCAFWMVTERQKARLLGLSDEETVATLKRLPLKAVSSEVIERIAILLEIFGAVNSLLPVAERADTWMRVPNKASPFGGQSALAFMLDKGLPGLRATRDYLLSQIWSV